MYVIRFGEIQDEACIKKKIRQCCIFLPSIFNAYIQEANNIIRDKIHLGIMINFRKIDMPRFADDVSVIAEIEKEWQGTLMHRSNAAQLNKHKNKYENDQIPCV